MVTNEQIIKIVEAMAAKGHSIRVLDISYLLLCDIYDDRLVSYKSIFGNAEDSVVKAYHESKMITYLRDCLYGEGLLCKDDITFEENKRYMLKLKADTERAMANNEMEKKDGLKILADISVKLNDKFGAKEEVKDQIVQILHKYDDICPHCSHEVARQPMTKEEAMQKFNLIEKR